LKIVFDTNIILDVLLIREPYAQLSMNLFDAVVSQKIEGYLCATTITAIDYLVSKQHGKQKTRALIAGLLDLFRVAEVNQFILEQASISDFSDFEDAVLYQSGVFIKADGFVTRNIKDFKMAALPIYSPEALVPLIQTQAGAL